MTNNSLTSYSAFVTFLTAGYPSAASTVPAMLAMERGGSDVIELGIPFSDPIADGKAIQDANTVSVAHPDSSMFYQSSYPWHPSKNSGCPP